MTAIEVQHEFDEAIGEASRAGAKMMSLAATLFPICRSITGKGTRETLDVIGEWIPLNRHTVASGTKCFDWIVPPEWNIRDAYVMDQSGSRVIDFRKSNLHVVSYSAPVDATMTLEELRPRLHSLPEKPDAIPYLTTYYREDWGLCVADRQLKSLPDGLYRVCIDSTLAAGHLDYATASLGSGEAGDVLLASYICHPSMANNELSGPVLIAALHAALSRIRGLRHRYRFVLAPETIGTIAYLSANGHGLVERLRAGFVITCAGDDGPFTYKRSRRGDSLADRAALHALGSSVPEARLRVKQFDPTDGSDDRQYCSPGFDLPVGTFARSIYGTYPEYHTSLDDLSLFSERSLTDSLVALIRIIETIELNARYVRTDPYCEPQLGRRGLYPSVGGARTIESEVARQLYVLNYSDGAHDLLEIAARMGEPIWKFASTVTRLCDAGLLTQEA